MLIRSWNGGMQTAKHEKKTIGHLTNNIIRNVGKQQAQVYCYHTVRR